MSIILTVSLALSRTLYVAFVIVALLTFPQMRQLLDNAWTKQGSTLYVPLVICQPDSIEVDGSIISFDANDVGGCFTMNFLVNACAASLLLSSLAVIIFLVMDVLWRWHNPKNLYRLSRNAGTGTFLTIILLQAAFCVGSLVREADFWVGYFSTMVNQMKASGSSSYNYDHVETYANRSLLWTTTGIGFLAAFVTAIEHLVGFCWRQGESRSNMDDPGSAKQSIQALQASKQQTQSVNTSSSVALDSVSSVDESKSTGSVLPTWLTLESP